MNAQKFNSVTEAALYLSRVVREDLLKQISIYGKAVLVMPGGQSIKPFFPYFIKLGVDWSKIIIGLSDERCVPLDDAMSNEKQLRQLFLDFIPNYNYNPLREEFLLKIRETPPITILSMGIDGHVASLFPEEAGDWKNTGGIGIFRTKKQDPNRVSLTEEVLLLSSKMYLLVVGKEKKQFIDEKLLFSFPLYSVFNAAILIKC
ncbi:MAG: hypothetical protein ACD_69C00103G0005 [uncultured bacterium]|nr:MAG: hypothetical protein ACD_69C00103G0005 [uncultured bacterium]